MRHKADAAEDDTKGVQQDLIAVTLGAVTLTEVATPPYAVGDLR